MPRYTVNLIGRLLDVDDDAELKFYEAASVRTAQRIDAVRRESNGAWLPLAVHVVAVDATGAKTIAERTYHESATAGGLEFDPFAQFHFMSMIEGGWAHALRSLCSAAPGGQSPIPPFSRHSGGLAD